MEILSKKIESGYVNSQNVYESFKNSNSWNLTGEEVGWSIRFLQITVKKSESITSIHLFKTINHATERLTESAIGYLKL